jgi:16S rRNA (adenine1518-N6/adenine1519-N6)-dimethyltransferase
VGRRLGQHFLFDPSILGRIADAAVASKTERVLEIGPGKGTLTRALAERAAHVTAIEKDSALLLDATGSVDRGALTVIHGDALDVEWPAVDVICGNIPYQITSPLIERALTPPRPKRIVFLMQREVADRLAAKPGEREYGALSAGVQLVATVERLFTVKAGSFQPPPRVESAVVRITPRSTPLARTPEEEAGARNWIIRMYQHRRQQIQRTLRESLGCDRDTVDRLLGTADLDPTARPEVLSPEDFLTIARLFPAS